MKTLLKHIAVFILLISVLACTPKNTLQSYFVENEEATAFVSMDIPISYLNSKKIVLSEDQSNAIDSIEKLNMIAYSLADGSQEEFESELVKIKEILKSDIYNDLMRMGNSSDGKAQISYIGDDSEIDELIIFGYSFKKGFAVVRVLGDNMQLSKILQLGDVINQLDTENTNIDSFMKYLL